MKPSPLWLILPTAAACADTLQPLGDEFNDPATFPRWQELGTVEGWVTPSYEQADIHTTTPGHFRIVPGAVTWYNHLRGLLFFKEVTGDFIVTTHLRVLSRHNPANPLEVPNRSFSLSGLFLHAPRAITHAAPVPYTTEAVWPPQNFGSDYVPGTENYLFLSYGSAGNPGTRQFEIKATRNSDSRLYYSANAVPQGDVNQVWLQLVRVGDTIVGLRKHTEAGPWYVENRYPNPAHPFPEFGPTLQVGLTAYTDWDTAAPYSNGGVASSFHFNYAPPATGSPDLIAEVDYVRLQRPPAALTEAVLQGLSVSYNPATGQTANPPVELTASPAAAPYLGEAANLPLGTLAFAAPAFAAGETDGALTVTVTRSGASLDQPLSVNYHTAPGAATADDFTATTGTLTWAADDPAEKTLLIPLANDHLTEGDETFSLTLSALDGPATFPASAPEITVPLTIHDHPFDQWRVDRFGLATASTPDAAPAADPDHDGLANLLEYLFNTDPLASSDTATQPVAVFENGRPGLRFTPVTTDGLRLRVELSSDLATWTPLATLPPGATTWTVDTPGVEILSEDATLTLLAPPADTASRFVRLRVETGP